MDAFSGRPFEGNPAAVCLLPAPRGEAWMRDVAREMNVSETAFLWPLDGGAHGLRWFTASGVEVWLCGHATLASAHVLWEEGRLDGRARARFRTRGGPLAARLTGGGVEIDLPSEPGRETGAPPDLIRALGVEPVRAGRNRIDHLVEVASEEQVRGPGPDLRLLAAATEGSADGVIVTALAAPAPATSARRPPTGMGDRGPAGALSASSS